MCYDAYDVCIFRLVEDAATEMSPPFSFSYFFPPWATGFVFYFSSLKSNCHALQ